MTARRRPTVGSRRPGGRPRRPRRRRRWPSRWWTRTLAVAGTAVLVVALATGVDVLVLDARIGTLPVTLPSADGAATWLLVGSDSRATAPPGSQAFGTSEQAPGDHADAIVALRITSGRAVAVSVPRDLLVSPRDGEVSRVALLLERPADLVAGLCRTLDLPVNHLVVLSMDAFAGAVDDVGGVWVDVPTPVRDPGSGLDLPRSGRLRLDGAQALALVRSRHPEHLVDGAWVAAGDDDAGAGQRTTQVGAVFAALARAARARVARPWALQALAWTATGGLRVDPGTGLTDLLGLDPGRVDVGDLPVQPVPGADDGVGAQVDPTTLAALRTAGFPGTCASG